MFGWKDLISNHWYKKTRISRVQSGVGTKTDDISAVDKRKQLSPFYDDKLLKTPFDGSIKWISLMSQMLNFFIIIQYNT